MAGLLKRYVKYVGTSVTGTVVDTLVLWLLSDYVFTGGYWGEYLLSPAISFQCAVAVNFTISYFYVWKDRTHEGSGGCRSRFFKLYLAYNLSSSTIFLIRFVILLLIERFTGWDVVVCNLIAMCFSGIINFTVNNFVIFRGRKH